MEEFKNWYRLLSDVVLKLNNYRLITTDLGKGKKKDAEINIHKNLTAFIVDIIYCIVEIKHNIHTNSQLTELVFCIQTEWKRTSTSV